MVLSLMTNLLRLRETITNKPLSLKQQLLFLNNRSNRSNRSKFTTSDNI